MDTNNKNNLIGGIRKWPAEKKRIFSIALALFITFLIIIFNAGMNLLWKDETKVVKNNPLNSLQESFSKVVEQASPTLEQVFSATQEMATQTQAIIDQINAAPSSFSTTSNIVE